MHTLRRFLVVVALAFWLGGFTFYAGVVVPIGTSVLKSPMKQALITRQVTTVLNLTGAAALVPLGWDAFATCDRAWRRRTRLGLWLFMALCQAGLFALHAHLNSLFDVVAMDVGDHDVFHFAHRSYLWLHTFQWGAGLVFIVLMLLGWRHEDGSREVRLVKSPPPDLAAPKSSFADVRTSVQPASSTAVAPARPDRSPPDPV
jgi:hypothetical protein